LTRFSIFANPELGLSGYIPEPYKEVPIGRLTLNGWELRLLLKEHGFRKKSKK
jgi:hypothetical protein